MTAIVNSYKKVIHLIISSLFILFLFPLSLPQLDDRTFVCTEVVKEGGLNDFIHQLPPTYTLERDSEHVVFGDGEPGRIPSTNSKHEEADGHIVFGDGAHGVIVQLCPTDDRVD